jgi:hypothetical protein
MYKSVHENILNDDYIMNKICLMRYGIDEGDLIKLINYTILKLTPLYSEYCCDASVKFKIVVNKNEYSFCESFCLVVIINVCKVMREEFNFDVEFEIL